MRRRPVSSQRILALESLEDRSLLSAGLFDAPVTRTIGDGATTSVVADFNNDGHPDVAILNKTDNTVSILLNNGSGGLLAQQTFAAGTAGSTPVAMVAADVTHDGIVDLVVAEENGDIDVLRGNGGGTFQAPVVLVPLDDTQTTDLTAIAVGTWAGAANSTIAVLGTYTRDSTPIIAFLELNADGQFVRALGSISATTFTCLTACDFDQNGYTDFLVNEYNSSNDTNVVVDFPDSSSGITGGTTIAEFTASAPISSLLCGDFNGDGLQDLVAVFSNTAVPQIAFGTGPGTTAAPVNINAGTPGVEAVAGDFNGDGALDLAIANPGTGDLTVLLNDGSGDFTAAAGSPLNGASDLGATGLTGVAAGDFNGDGGDDLLAVNGLSDSAALLLSRFRTKTALSLLTGSDPSTFGQSVTFQASVSAAIDPAYDGIVGAVQFFDNGAPLGSPVSVNASGVADFTTSELPAGPQSIAAVFTGTSGFASSTSAFVTQAVNKVDSTTSVQSSLSPSTYGETIIFTATVTSSTGAVNPTGTVTFFDGSTNLGTGPISGDSASLSISTLSVGVHPAITAVFNGDNNWSASPASPAISQTVEKALTSLALAVTPTSSVTGGELLSFTATITFSGSGTPTGSVAFTVGGVNLGSAPLSGGLAILNTTAMPVGAGQIVTATYSGDGNYVGSSNTTEVTVNPAISFETAELPDWDQNLAGYSAQILISGGTGMVSFSLQTGSSLPTGLSLGSNGEISGKPTEAGSSTFFVVATDSNDVSTIQRYTIVVNAPLTFTTPSPLAASIQDVPSYLQTIVATGGTGQLTFSLTSGSSLPAGLNLSNSGVISGTPTAAGVFDFSDTVIDRVGGTSVQDYSITISPTVTSATTTSVSGTYGAGATILISLQFGANVDVTGTPTLVLTSGGNANYISGSGTSTLVFSYVVAAPQSSSALDYDGANSLSLNGGTIVQAGIGQTNNASLILPTPGGGNSLSPR